MLRTRQSHFMFLKYDKIYSKYILIKYSLLKIIQKGWSFHSDGINMARAFRRSLYSLDKVIIVAVVADAFFVSWDEKCFGQKVELKIENSESCSGRSCWLVGWLVGCVTLPETNISHLNTWPSQRKTSLRTINIQGLLLLGRGHPFQNPPKMKIQGTVLKKDQEGEILVHFQFSFCSTFLSLLW